MHFNNQYSTCGVCSLSEIIKDIHSNERGPNSADTVESSLSQHGCRVQSDTKPSLKVSKTILSTSRLSQSEPSPEPGESELLLMAAPTQTHQ